ncbi:MAG: hypothetical protein GEU93_03240 [Propionibacteriales bacterium]|nr:hypothetical protein [Propionibacteriales bacterium]
MSGEVPQYPLPAWVWDDEVLIEAAERLANLHEVTATFEDADGVWQLPAHHPIGGVSQRLSRLTTWSSPTTS